MWTNLKTRIDRLILRSKFIRPKTLVIAGGIVSYSLGMGAYAYFHPEQLNASITNTMHELSRIQIPKFARKFVYTTYSKRYGVNLQEVEKPLWEYHSLNQFFTRKIINRQITAESFINRMFLSPSDSTVLSISEVTENSSLIIKGINYSLSQLLYEVQENESTNIPGSLKHNPNSKLYQIILYLSPADYHRFHSPTNISIRAQRNIPGKLRPVNKKSLLKYGGSVYEENSRKILHSVYRFPGQQTDSYLGLAFIAALNVSDTEVYNQTVFEAGEELGRFNLGSTIVMLIEAGTALKWKCGEGQKVKYGDVLAELQKE